MKLISLNGEWLVKAAGLDCSGVAGIAQSREAAGPEIAARVPGEIHLDLMRAGLMPEPLFSVNAPECRWPERHSWWYRRSFEVPLQFPVYERVRLVCDRLDLYGQVFLNGRQVGECENAFVAAIFDARPFLKPGSNEIVIRLTCGTERAACATPAENGGAAVDEAASRAPYYARRRQAAELRGRLRKPQFSYGWDWVDALPNIGIRGGVRLEAHSGVVIHDTRFETLFHGSRVFLNMEAVVENLHVFESRECVLELETAEESGAKPIRRRYEFSAPPGRSQVRDSIEIPNPRLWWPNGMGGQPLYKVKLRTVANGRLCDRREYRIGLRTISVDRSRLSEGRRFCIRVNGRDVFCKGANWVPADAIMARVDSRRYRRLIAEAQDAGFNMLRVWGGGIYEADEFYDACDRAGILVWQDFMFACTEYPDDEPAFLASVRSEAEAAVMRLRHHPSIALWCGNNENTSWAAFGRSKKGFSIYNQVLPDVCRALDPGRFYWPSSPCGGPTPVSETDGDAHPWPYTMGPDCHILPDDPDKLRCRFISEYGVIGPPVLESIRQYLKPAELNPHSEAWKTHTNEFENGLLRNAIAHHYAAPETLNMRQYLLYGAMFQAVQYGHYIEAARFRKLDPRDDCEGFLFWMYADCWGEIGWTVIDYYLRRKPAFYAVKRAYRPLKVAVRPRGNELVVRVLNDTLRPCKAAVTAGWRRVDGTDARLRRLPVRVAGCGMAEVCRESLVPPAEATAEWVYGAMLESEGWAPDISVWVPLPYRRMRLAAAPEIKVRRRGGGALELVSAVFCHGVHAEDQGEGLFSDNYFDLLPDVPKRINLTAGSKGRIPQFKCVIPLFAGNPGQGRNKEER